jgi:hypothetical protein
MTWIPTTDDDFTKPDVANALLELMQDSGSAQSELSGFGDNDERMWTLCVAIAPDNTVVVFDINWETQEIITAWKPVETYTAETIEMGDSTVIPVEEPGVYKIRKRV